MKDFVTGIGVIAQLELRQRVRGTAWYVLLGIFTALVAVVTVILATTLPVFSADDDGRSAVGAGIFSTIIYFVLFLSTLVAPALSGNAINGDREAGTLATTQITLVSTWQLVLGKFLAAWATALAFLAVAVPFMAFTALTGGLDAATVVVSVLVLTLELGVVAGIGVGLSGILSRPLFSIVVTYLVVAALSVGTLIAFVLGALTIQSESTSTYYSASDYTDTGEGIGCTATGETNSYPVPRYDYFWGFLAANPYVVLADAIPTRFDANGSPQDLFGFIKTGVRSAQIPPDLDQAYNDCEPYEEQPTAEEIISSTVPGWFVGLLIHGVLAAAALVGAWRSVRTPAGRLLRGSRIA